MRPGSGGFIYHVLGSYARNLHVDFEECVILVYDGPSYPTLF